MLTTVLMLALYLSVLVMLVTGGPPDRRDESESILG